MQGDLIIGIDAGTSVIKAVVFDLMGREIAMAARANCYESREDGGVEQDMGRTWKDTAAVLAELTERMPDLAARTITVAVTGQGDGTWLIDAEGQPVGKGWLWLDSRAAGLVEGWVGDGTRDRAFQITGCGVTPCNSSSQLAWMQRYQPDVLRQAVTAFHPKDWLYLKLTGIVATDVSEATFTFGDFRTSSYSQPLIELFGLGPLRHLLPDPIDGTRTSNPITAEAARLTGLRAGTPITLAYVDIVCTALGGGLYDELGDVGMTVVGSTGMHMQLVKNVQGIDPGSTPSGYIIPFPIQGHVARLQTNMSGTLNIDWVLRLATDALTFSGVTADRNRLLGLLDASVAASRPASAIYHPYIHAAGERGPFLDSRARAMLTGLTMEVGLPELLRSVYEGLAFASRDCHAAIGPLPAEIRVAGGASRSRAFKTILASVLERPLRESTRGEAGAAGAAMMAAVGQGVFPDMAAAARIWVTPCLGGRVEPDPELVPCYRQFFELYRETRLAAAPLWHRLAAAREAAAPANQPLRAAV
ncbi:erythritol kinase (L-erythritol 4-phosphate-forming) [Arboricoccus pini]|uniref:Erythritol kinase (L-erythritol 4-phosphate-forming) n=1 Tax=Arboricoccus pini TaxID=1963835 RepID=A0A212RR09_9PROT|nr:FGGY-family carbohydrate kinase [Arboricoccus pini]SNB74849.1 erythritol kinase (L-erythritol 4-phosphate-forming) [Arboricoccus pini]